jgi:hypothetical protein
MSGEGIYGARSRCVASSPALPRACNRVPLLSRYRLALRRRPICVSSRVNFWAAIVILYGLSKVSIRSPEAMKPWTTKHALGDLAYPSYPGAPIRRSVRPEPCTAHPGQVCQADPWSLFMFFLYLMYFIFMFFLFQILNNFKFSRFWIFTN